MPLDNILYYPSINLPKTPWVIQSVLYWDQVSTIVPYEYTENPDLLNKEMRELVISGAVKQEPTSFFGPEQYNASKEVFKMLFENQHTFPELKQNFSAGKVWEIHKEKFDDELFLNLLAWGLASKHNSKENWYWVEESVAACMMTMLASLIGAETKATPSTDDMKFLPGANIFLPGTTEAEHLRGRILDEVMPYPENVDLADLVSFKEKHLEDLRDFRRLVEHYVLQLKAIENNQLKEETIQSQIAEITDRRIELTARLKENKLGKIALSSVKGAFFDGAIAVVTGDIITPSATLLKGLVEVRKQYLQKPIQDDNLAYLALLHKRVQ